MINLDELEHKAQAATPGPWEWDSSPCLYGPPRTVDYGLGPELARTQIIETDSGHYPPAPADREHIAANSPPVTLALIVRIRELENTLDSCGDYSRHGDRIRRVILKGAVPR